MRKKCRSLNQIKEEISYQVLREKLPEAWVIHEYGPDYGIDCVIELFDYINDKKTMAETLGENFYVQLKSSGSVEYKTIKAFPRMNVEKGSFNENKPKEYINIEVAKFQLEMSELLTVQSMGLAVPVLLILVDTNTKRAFFICLNDYIDKILIPKNKKYSNDGSKVLNIPIQNEITNEHTALRVYGKRSKMYGAFSKFYYQKNEIEKSYFHIVENENNLAEIINMLSIFTETAIRQDIWDGHEFWQPVKQCYKMLEEIETYINKGIKIEDQKKFIEYSLTVWNQLTNLGNMYEELVREWYMPTFLAQLTSYPEIPEPIKLKT